MVALHFSMTLKWLIYEEELRITNLLEVVFDFGTIFLQVSVIPVWKILTHAQHQQAHDDMHTSRQKVCQSPCSEGRGMEADQPIKEKV